MREGKKWETEQLMRFTCWKLFICQRSENPGCTSLSVLHHSSDSLQTWWLDCRGPWYHVVLRFWLKVAVLVQCVQGHKYTDQTERSFHSPQTRSNDWLSLFFKWARNVQGVHSEWMKCKTKNTNKTLKVDRHRVPINHQQASRPNKPNPKSKA